MFWDFFCKPWVRAHVTIYTMSPASPVTQKGQEIELNFLYHKNPVSYCHMLYAIWSFFVSLLTVIIKSFRILLYLFPSTTLLDTKDT